MKTIFLYLISLSLIGMQLLTSSTTHLELLRIGKFSGDYVESFNFSLAVFSGVVASFSAIFETGQWYGVFTGVYILIIPLFSLYLFKNKYYLLTLLFLISVVLSTSTVVAL